MEIQDLIDEGLTLEDASMALEAYHSSRIEGAKTITAKRLAEMIIREECHENTTHSIVVTYRKHMFL